MLCSAAPDAAHPVVRSACRLQVQGLRTLRRPPAREYSTPDPDSIHSFQCTQPSCLHALMPGRVLAPTDAAGSPDARLSTTWAPLLYDPLLRNHSHYSVVGSGATGRIASAVSSETTKKGPSAVSSETTNKDPAPCRASVERLMGCSPPTKWCTPKFPRAPPRHPAPGRRTSLCTCRRRNCQSCAG